MGTEWDQETFVHNQLNSYPFWARISVPSFGCKDEEMQVSMCLTTFLDATWDKTRPQQAASHPLVSLGWCR